ncbi:hypothetical protein [Mesorhizobium sp.]|uniref:hypothetical protein n=1 Tax=Mesorhizobium sp. TaxID=1871066 RepID=UPI000FE55B78|nr:hypothetical protein [Mesorhizobium sp.]RWI63457.1 MAG: hypothetical protein EOR18_31435 [Mesorhizobium sp.]
MVGKRVRDALYVHRTAVDGLKPELRELLEAASQLVGDRPWNVARIEQQAVGLLLYEAFDAAAFPALIASTRIDLASGAVSSRNFKGSANPLILHRKEQLVSAEHPEAALWAELTAKLEALGCFRDPHLIGRRKAWEARLEAAGVRVEGHALCPI